MKFEQIVDVQFGRNNASSGGSLDTSQYAAIFALNKKNLLRKSKYNKIKKAYITAKEQEWQAQNNGQPITNIPQAVRDRIDNPSQAELVMYVQTGGIISARQMEISQRQVQRRVARVLMDPGLINYIISNSNNNLSFDNAGLARALNLANTDLSHAYMYSNLTLLQKNRYRNKLYKRSRKKADEFAEALRTHLQNRAADLGLRRVSRNREMLARFPLFSNMANFRSVRMNYGPGGFQRRINTLNKIVDKREFGRYNPFVPKSVKKWEAETRENIARKEIAPILKNHIVSNREINRFANNAFKIENYKRIAAEAGISPDIVTPAQARVRRFMTKVGRRTIGLVGSKGFGETVGAALGSPVNLLLGMLVNSKKISELDMHSGLPLPFINSGIVRELIPNTFKNGIAGLIGLPVGLWQTIMALRGGGGEQKAAA